MPRKPKTQARQKKQFRRPFNKRRKFVGNKENMINRMPRASHSVVAPHFYTTLESSFYGYVGATAGTSAGQFVIQTNSAYLPYYYTVHAGHSFTDMTFAFLSPGTVALNMLQPNGFSKLAGLYKNYRVYKYTAQVTATPASPNDTVGLSIVPCSSDIAAVLGLSQQEVMALPYSKAVMCSQANNVTRNRVVSTMMPRTILGLTKAQYKDEYDTGSAVGTSPTIITLCVVTYNTLDGMDLSASLYFECKIRLWLEFFEPESDLGVV